MKNILICVTGGSGSGKSTISNEVYNLISPKISKQIICMDNYYKSKDIIKTSDNKLLNYDHPLSFDYELLISDLKALMSGKKIRKIYYDYKKSLRHETNEYIDPTNVIILEGIMACREKEILKMSSLNIFVDTPNDERFIRRLQRDIKERDRTVDSVINQWRMTVKPMYLEFIETQKENVDIIIPWYKMNRKVITTLNGAIQELLKK